MTHLLRTVVCTSALSMVLAGSAVSSTSPTTWEEFDRYLKSAMEDWRVPGLAIAVVRGDETVFLRGYGTTSLEGGTPVDQHTLFSVGSTTKAMAAAALGLLVDRGEVSWDTPVSDVLPQFRLSDPTATARLRVRDLLTHSAGVPNTDFLWYEQDRTLDDILFAMRHAPMESAPGSRFTYQNVMYAAAGKVTEVLSGQSWSTFVERELFAPLGMERSVATLEGTARRSNVAKPHHIVDGEMVTIQNASVDPVAAAGSVWSSAHDLARWTAFLLRGCKTESGTALLEEQTCNELFEPQVIVGREMYPVMRLYEHKWLTYGLGWFQTDYRGRALDFHTGSIDGLVALIGLLRAEGIGVYVLANLDHAEVRHALLLQALDLLDPRLGADDRRDWHAEVKELYDSIAEGNAASAPREPFDPRPPLAAEHYVGTYNSPLGGEVLVTSAGEQLELRWGQQSCRLEHLGGDAFLCPWSARWRGTARFEFLPQRDPEQSTLRLGGLQFRRQTDDSP